MNFPNISFFYKINSFYSDIRLSFLCDYYFKLHNILFTNLYIRIYRYKLTKIEKKKIKINSQEKYKKIDRDLFLDKIKKKKRGFLKRKLNMVVTEEIKRNYYSNLFLLISNENKNVKKDSYKRSKKKKNYVYVNKFKDCGNQYNFDPFYPGTTFRLNDYNFYRTKKLKKRTAVVQKQKIDFSIFDSRLSDANFKYFNNYLFNLLLEVYNNKNTDKKLFLSMLKNSTLFFSNFLRFLKRKITYIRLINSNFRKLLRSYIYKLNLINQSFFFETDKLPVLLSYLKSKNSSFFKLYTKLVNNYITAKDKIESSSTLLSLYTNIYNSLFTSLKKKYNTAVSYKKQKSNISNHFKKVNRAEKQHHTITNLFANSMRFFNVKDINKWEKKKMKNNIYITMNKYVTLYRSLFKYEYLNNHFSNNAIIYIKATATNVYLYFLYNNKLLFKKSCGELPDVKKKERRFWRNIYPLVESLLPFIVQMKSKYKFPFVSLYLNGSSSLCTPLISRIRKHNKKFRRIIYFLFNEMDFFYNKTLEIKDKYRNRYNFYPVYRLKYYSILDGFNRLSKIFFAVNKVKDITSWPYNGCKKKKKKNVR